MKCIIDGAYGFNNIGDEAMLSTASKVISGASNDIEIVVSSYLPHRISELHGLKSTNYLLLGTFIRGILGFRLSELRDQFHYFKTIDLFVFAGGSILNDAKGLRPLLVILYKVLLSRIFNFSLTFWGVSIGPVKTRVGYKILSWILKQSDLIILRDDASSSMAIKMVGKNNSKKVISGVDILFSLDTGESGTVKDIVNKQMEHFRVGLSVRPYPPLIGVDVKEIDDLLVTQLSRLCEMISDSYNVVFVPLVFSEGNDHKDDSRMLEKIKVKSPNSHFESSSSNISEINDQSYPDYLASLVDTYNKLDLVIGERFHSLVLSQLLCVPYIGLSYDAKIDGLAKYSSTEEYLIDLMKELLADQLDVKAFQLFKMMVESGAPSENTNSKTLAQAASDRLSITNHILSL